MTVVLLTSALCAGSFAAAEAGKEPAARTILIWANGADLEQPTGKISVRLRTIMDEEIPDTVNIVVLTGGVKGGWDPAMPLEGAESVRADCNQVWKMKGTHDGQQGALVLLEKDGVPGAEKDSMSHPLAAST